MPKFIPFSSLTATKSALSVLGMISEDPANVIYLNNYQAENKHCNEGLTKVHGSSGKTLITTHTSNSTRFNFSGTGKVEFVENGTMTLKDDYRAHMFIKDGELHTPIFEAQLTEPVFQALSTVPGLLSFPKFVPGMTVTVDLSKVPLVSPDLADVDALIEGLCKENLYKAIEKNLKAAAKAAQVQESVQTAPEQTTVQEEKEPVQQVELTVPYCEYSVNYVPTEEEIGAYKGTLAQVRKDLRQVRYETRARELALEKYPVALPWVQGKDYKAKGGQQTAYTLTCEYNGVPIVLTKKVGTQVIKVDA